MANIALIGYYFLFTEKPEQPRILQSPVQEIQILWLDYFIINENVYDIVARIKNPNLDYAAEVLEYKFLFLNEHEEVLAQVSDIDYININQEKYLMLTNYDFKPLPQSKSDENDSSVLDQNLSSIKLILNQDWVKIKNPLDTGIQIQNSTLKESPETYTIAANIINNSNFDFNQIDVLAVLKDKDEKVVAINNTLLHNIKSSEKKEFTLIWHNPLSWLPRDVANIDIEAYTNEVIKLSIN